jgi:hypothetical protein
MFVDLVNKQLEKYNLTYMDIRNDPNWYMKYTTTTQEENRFIDWAVYYLIDNGISTKKAEEEVSWFILQYGLTLNKETAL